jgi:parvulin-like peptidyl-prolyl isomerase
MRSSRRVSTWIAAAGLALAMGLGAHLTIAQSPAPASGGGASPWGGARPASPAGGVTSHSGAAPVPAPSQKSTTTPAPPPQVIARVDGRPITQRDWDRIATPYFAQLKAELGDRFQSIEPVAKKNVLNELVRQQVVALEAQKQKIEVTDKDVDDVLRRESYFQTNGKVDEAKLAMFKSDPTSNYQQMLPQLREIAAAAKYDATLRKRFQPTPEAVRAEWERRNDKIRCKVLPLEPRSLSLDPEATDAERHAYYHDHPRDFTAHTQLRLRWYRIAVPAGEDSVRQTVVAAAMKRAKGVADSLRTGALADTMPGVMDTGFFEVPTPSVPTIGRVPELSDALAKADTVTSIVALGPFDTADGVLVARIIDRKPRHLLPYVEALPDVKRRADQDKRRREHDTDLHGFYQAHPDSFREARARLTRLTLDENAANVTVTPQEIDAWYKAHGHSLFGRADSSHAWLPPLDDSLKAKVRRRIESDKGKEWRSTRLEKLASGFGTSKDPKALARANQAAAETLTLRRGGLADSLFSAALVDSLLRAGPGSRGQVQGPRAFTRRWALWRVEWADTAFLPAFDAARPQVERLLAAQRRREDEAEARTRFEAHRVDYKMPVRYVIDYIMVAPPLADSVKISEAELKAVYQKNLASYTEPEQVRARHILISLRDPTPAGDAKARARADSVERAIKAGASFVDLAERLSDDPGSGANGGDLDWFPHGRMVKEFDEVVFAMNVGDVSAPIKTRFGYHIIRLDDRRAARVKPFAEARRDIRDKLATARADTIARREATKLLSKLTAGGDPKVLATSHGGLKNAGPFAASDSPPTIGMTPGLGDDLPKMTPRKWAKRPYRAGNRYVAIRVAERQPVRPAEFDEIENQALADARQAKLEERFGREVPGIRAALTGGGSFDSVAALYGGLKDTGLFTQMQNFVPNLGFEARVIEAAFKLAPRAVSDTLRAAQNPGVFWLRQEEKVHADEKDFKTTEPQITQDLVTKAYVDWVDERKGNLKIEVIRSDLVALK